MERELSDIQEKLTGVNEKVEPLLQAVESAATGAMPNRRW